MLTPIYGIFFFGDGRLTSVDGKWRNWSAGCGLKTYCLEDVKVLEREMRPQVSPENVLMAQMDKVRKDIEIMEIFEEKRMYLDWIFLASDADQARQFLANAISKLERESHVLIHRSRTTS